MLPTPRESRNCSLRMSTVHSASLLRKRESTLSIVNEEDELHSLDETIESNCFRMQSILDDILFMERLVTSVRMGSVGGPRPPALSSTVSSFEGSRQGAVWSIFSNTGFSKPSRRGAEHRINFAFVSQSWSKSKLLEITS